MTKREVFSKPQLLLQGGIQKNQGFVSLDFFVSFFHPRKK